MVFALRSSQLYSEERSGKKQLQHDRIHALVEAGAVGTQGALTQLELDRGSLPRGGDLDSGS